MAAEEAVIIGSSAIVLIFAYLAINLDEERHFFGKWFFEITCVWGTVALFGITRALAEASFTGGLAEAFLMTDNFYGWLLRACIAFTMLWLLSIILRVWKQQGQMAIWVTELFRGRIR